MNTPKRYRAKYNTRGRARRQKVANQRITRLTRQQSECEIDKAFRRTASLLDAGLIQQLAKGKAKFFDHHHPLAYLRSLDFTRRAWKNVAQLLKVVMAKNVKSLITPAYIVALSRAAQLPMIRKPEDWKPKEKSAWKLFKSLVNHLCVRYKIPESFYHLLYFEQEIALDVVLEIFETAANGKSVAKLGLQGINGVQLTRQMSHQLLNLQFSNLSEAIRFVQITGQGGSCALASALARNQHVRREMVYEEAYARALGYFARQTTNDVEQIEKILLWLLERFPEGNLPDLSRRTIASLQREMDHFRHDERLAKRTAVAFYTPSGIEGGILHTFGNENIILAQYEFLEISGDNQLLAEGRAMHHCVFTYRDDVLSGKTSIWSLRKNGYRLATIEIENSSRSIVQVRKKCNNLADEITQHIIQQWAKKATLTIFEHTF